MLFRSRLSYRFNIPLIYRQELIASKYNLAAFNQSPCPGAETALGCVYLFAGWGGGDFKFIYVFVLFHFPIAAVFCGRSVLFARLPFSSERL